VASKKGNSQNGELKVDGDRKKDQQFKMGTTRKRTAERDANKHWSGWGRRRDGWKGEEARPSAVAGMQYEPGREE